MSEEYKEIDNQQALQPGNMDEWRKNPDGTLWVPRRGRPPLPPQGYEYDPVNPYHCIISLDPCFDRIEEIFVSPGCGCKKLRIRCLIDDKTVTRGDCKSCELRT